MFPSRLYSLTNSGAFFNKTHDKVEMKLSFYKGIHEIKRNVEMETTGKVSACPKKTLSNNFFYSFGFCFFNQSA